MKFLLYSFLLLPLSIYTQDTLLLAIKLSNPTGVQREIDKRLLEGKPFSPKEQLLYLNFCEEVITRRRNAIQFPEYYNGSATHNAAFSTDPIEIISGVTVAKFLVGSFGALFTFPICATILDNRMLSKNERVFWTAVPFVLETLTLYLLLSSVMKINQTLANQKNSQEQLYENAIKIKSLFYDIVTI